MREQIEAIIRKHLDLDTVHIEYHREAVDMIGDMATEIEQLYDSQLENVVYEIQAGEEV